MPKQLEQIKWTPKVKEMKNKELCLDVSDCVSSYQIDSLLFEFQLIFSYWKVYVEIVNDSFEFLISFSG